MIRLSSFRGMLPLLCALVPAAVACGGGDGGGTEVGDDEPMNMGEGGSGDEGSAGADNSKSGSATVPAEGGAPGDEPQGNAGMPAVDEGDTDAPTVISSLPADGAVGVNANSNIQIQFSEPMDKDSVEQAYQSEDLPAGALSFSWNGDGTWLTITPTEMLEYASGNDPEATLAKAYALTIGSAATDVAGNPLGEDALLSFTTLRDIMASIPAHTDLSGYVNLGNTVGGPTISAGDTLANNANRGLITFDLSSVPETYQVVLAQLVARQLQSASAFVDLSADANPAKLRLFRRTFATRAEAAAGIAGEGYGLFSNSAEAGTRTVTATGPVQDDLENRVELGNLNQFTFEFPKASDGKTDIDSVTFAEVSLELHYMTP
jgi:hypothetical protein